MRKVNLPKQNTSIEEVYKLTSQGLNIFIKELGISNFRKNISSVFRTDKNPSVRVKQSSISGLWLYNDYTTGEYYTAITFVQKKYNLSFKEAVEYIILNNTFESNFVKVEKTFVAKEKLQINYEVILFNECHKEYWMQGGMDEEYVNSQHIFAISRYEMYGKVYNCDCSFVYEYIDEKGNLQDYCKILNLNVIKKKKWLTNLPNSMMWGLHTIQNNTKVIICKSYKDAVLLRKYGYCVIALQSENSVVFNKEFPKLKENYPLVTEWILLFGIDEDATKKAKEIVEVYPEIRNFKLPIYYWNTANDPFAIYSILGKEKFEQFIENL